MKVGDIVWYDTYDWGDPDQWKILQVSEKQMKIERISNPGRTAFLRGSDLEKVFLTRDESLEHTARREHRLANDCQQRAKAHLEKADEIRSKKEKVKYERPS